MPRVAKEKSPAGSKADASDSTATIGFEAKLWLPAEQAVPAPHFAETEYNGGRPQGLLGLIFPGAGLKIAWGPAARGLGRGQGGEAGGASRTGHSPQRAVTAEPTPATGKRPAARRGFGGKAGWLRCSSVGDRCGYPLVPVRKHSRLAIQPFPRKQDSHGISRPAPEYISDTDGQCRMSNAKVRTRNAQPLRHSKFVLRHLPPPADARWSHLQASAKQPTIGKTVDDAMVAIERDNPRLKGVLPKDCTRPGPGSYLPEEARTTVRQFRIVQIGRSPNP